MGMLASILLHWYADINMIFQFDTISGREYPYQFALYLHDYIGISMILSIKP
jgi:hypothetical protein